MESYSILERANIGKNVELSHLIYMITPLIFGSKSLSHFIATGAATIPKSLPNTPSFRSSLGGEDSFAYILNNDTSEDFHSNKRFTSININIFKDTCTDNEQTTPFQQPCNSIAEIQSRVETSNNSTSDIIHNSIDQHEFNSISGNGRIVQRPPVRSDPSTLSPFSLELPPRSTEKVKLPLFPVPTFNSSFPQHQSSITPNRSTSNTSSPLYEYFQGLFIVADGVGGWASAGVDPSKFTTQLLESLVHNALNEQYPNISSIGEYFNTWIEHSIKSFEKNIPGSCTLSVVGITPDNTLYSLNLGDSGFIVLRPTYSEQKNLTNSSQSQQDSPQQPKKSLERHSPYPSCSWVHSSKSFKPNSTFPPLNQLIQRLESHCPEPKVFQTVHRSQDVLHDFNFPYQLSYILNDRPAEASLSSFQLEKGDIVVMATDGVFDNLFDSTISNICSSCIDSFQGEEKEQLYLLMAQNIIKASYSSMNSNSFTPFGLALFENQRQMSFRNPTQYFGKIDDSCCVVFGVD